jgi:hypothetical protein
VVRRRDDGALDMMVQHPPETAAIDTWDDREDGPGARNRCPFTDACTCGGTSGCTRAPRRKPDAVPASSTYAVLF